MQLRFCAPHSYYAEAHQEIRKREAAGSHIYHGQDRAAAKKGADATQDSAKQHRENRNPQDSINLSKVGGDNSGPPQGKQHSRASQENGVQDGDVSKERDEEDRSRQHGGVKAHRESSGSGQVQLQQA